MVRERGSPGVPPKSEADREAEPRGRDVSAGIPHRAAIPVHPWKPPPPPEAEQPGILAVVVRPLAVMPARDVAPPVDQRHLLSRPALFCWCY